MICVMTRYVLKTTSFYNYLRGYNKIYWFTLMKQIWRIWWIFFLY